jgi:hypothetical protein
MKKIVLLVPSILLTAIALTPQQATQRIPQFENDDVKVWRSVVVPNSPLTMHRHDHGRVIIPIVGGTMKIVTQAGGSETHQWDIGKAYWLPSNPPNELHADVNAGKTTIEVMVVELKRPYFAKKTALRRP